MSRKNLVILQKKSYNSSTLELKQGSAYKNANYGD